MTKSNRGSRAILAGLIMGVVAAGAATVAFASDRGSEGTPTRGTIPERAFRSEGSLDPALVPDLISVENDRGAVVGYARSKDIASPDAAPASIVDVWDETGERLVGHVYPDGTGFLSTAEEKERGVDASNPPEPLSPPTTAVG